MRSLAQGPESSARRRAHIFVANSRGNSVLGFSDADTGDVPPRTFIAGSRTGISDPIGIAVAPDGRLAVASAHAVVSVFAAGAHGNMLPIYEITCGSMTVPLGSVYDSNDNLYVTNERYRSAITAFTPVENGCVAGNRVISGRATRLIDPRGIQLDVQNRIVVADSGETSIFTFAAGANGDVPPLSTISGPSTGLAQPRGLVQDVAGNTYVANFGNNSITEYTPSARGDSKPLRMIRGDKTQLDGPTGLAISSNGSLYVSNFLSNTIVTFAPGAFGNVAPRTDITGPRTQLEGPYNITVQE